MAPTKRPALPFPKPAGYDADQYELLLRIFNAGWRETFEKFERKDSNCMVHFWSQGN
jgi:hypothetical protein